MCESYNLQFGTNYIAVMPTNLYGPNDNFDLEKSHVLPAMLRKMYLGKCLEENNFDAIRADLKKRPIDGHKGDGAIGRIGDEAQGRTGDEAIGRTGEKATKREDYEILKILNKYGIRVDSSPERPIANAHLRLVAPSPSRPVAHSPERPIVSVEIWGSGAPMREFLWSEEMADACVFIMEHTDFNDIIRDNSSSIRDNSHLNNSHSSKEIRNTHINIGTGHELSIRDLAYLIKEKVGFKGELTFNTSKPDGTMRKLTDVSKLNALGWKHQIEIGEGVERLIGWYLSN